MDLGSGRSSGNGDSGSERLSQTQREVNFKRQRNEYIAMKQARKQQIIRRRKQQFGSSSSDEDDSDYFMSPSSPIQNKKSKETHPQPKVEEVKKTISPQFSQKLSIYLPNKKGNMWSQDLLQFKPSGKICFTNSSYEVKGVDKIKLMVQLAVQYIYKIKLTFTNGNQLIFGASSVDKKIGLPLLYYIFSKIIQQKVVSSGIKLTQNINQKLQGIPQATISKAFKYGKILKKSQILGNWQERLIVFNEKGLFSYKKYTDKHTMFIQKSTVNEIWSRFETQSKMLVIKLKYNQKKTEFGIPFSDYESSNSWLYHFYCLSIITP